MTRARTSRWWITLAIAVAMSACTPTTTIAGDESVAGEVDPPVTTDAPLALPSDVACTSGWEDQWRLGIDAIVFLRPRVTQPEVDEVRGLLEASSLVATATYIDQSQAFAEFEQRFANSDEIRLAVQPEDVPTSFRLVLRDDDSGLDRPAVEGFIDELRREPGVFDVVDSLCHS